MALAAAAICLVTFLFVTRGSWAIALVALLSEMPLVAVWLAASLGIGAALLVASRLSFQSSVLRIVCAVAVGWGSISLLVLALGLLGWMNIVTAWVIVVAGIALLLWRMARASKPTTAPELTGWAWLWLLAAPALGIALACAFVPPGLLWGADEPNGYDVVEYHFQVPREWYEARRIRPLEHNVFSYFPFKVEMHYLLAMHLRGGPWAGMYLAQLMHVAFVVLSVLAVYALLREAGARYATLGAVATAAAPWLILLAPIGYNEGGLLLFGTLAIGLMMIALRRAGPRGLAALAGAMAGFACGSKLTAVPMVLLAVPLAAVLAALLARDPDVPMRRMLMAVAVFIVSGTLVFSPWLLRNLVWTGNPVFPEATAIFGRAHFSEVQVERWRRAHSPREDQTGVAARLLEFARQVPGDWRFGSFLLLPLAVAAAALSWRDPRSLYLLTILIVMAIVWLAWTHLQGRFFVLSIPLAGMLIGALNRRPSAIGFAALIALATVAGLINLSGTLRTRAPAFQALGLEDLTVFTPLADVPIESADRVALVGDARAFLYRVPSGRLHYRTVFDVDARDEESSVDAWLRGATAPPGTMIVLLDPGELKRFTRTYWRVPPPPDDVAQRGQPFILRR